MSVDAISLKDVESMVSAESVAGQQVYEDSHFPHAYLCKGELPGVNSIVPWVSGHRKQLLEEATKHGAVLFRGLPLPTCEDFDCFVSALDLPNFPYKKSLSNAVSRK